MPYSRLLERIMGGAVWKQCEKSFLLQRLCSAPSVFKMYEPFNKAHMSPVLCFVCCVNREDYVEMELSSKP